MHLEFIESNNQSFYHNDKSIKYFSNLILNTQDIYILDLFISIFTAPQKCREKYFNKLKNYYKSIGIEIDNNFDKNVENFMKIRFQNAKGAFFEILTYELIKRYCYHKTLFKETYIKYKKHLSNHPFDIIIVNDDIKLLELKFSCDFLKISHLNNLIEFDDVESYLGSFDDSLKIKMKFEYIRRNSDLSRSEFNKFYSKINLISKNEFYDSILNKKCILDNSFNL